MLLIAIGFGAVLILTLATGYFVAQEFAYVTVDRNKLRSAAEAGDASAERAIRVTERLSFMLSGAQLGITVTALLVGYVSEPYMGQGLSQLLGTTLSPATTTTISFLAALLVSTFVQMVFGELGPKNWAIAEPERLAKALSRSTLIYLKVAGPLITFFDVASNKLLRAAGIEPVEELPQGATPEDLTRIIAESHTGGLLDEDLSDILGRGLAFRDHVAEEVMTPRVDVEMVHADDPASRVVELLESGHARFPVTGRDIDDIIGVVSISEVVQVPQSERATTAVRDIAIEPLRVPESLPLPRVLEALRSEHKQMAIVVDEHGGFAGVITFEDVAEEVVGEILDEDDEVPDEYVRREDGAWVLPARLRLDEIQDATNIRLPESENYDTASGLVMDRLGRTAETGDVVEIEWSDRDDEGYPLKHFTRLEVLAVSRFVPDEVAIHEPTTEREESANEEVAR